jgi:HEAT repeat protein
MQAIDRIGNCETLPILLVEALNSNEAALRAHALEILARAGDPVASDPIISALQDSDEQVRAVAARGLWDVIHAEECQPLLQFLNSPDPKVRAAIAGVLGKARASQWVAQLAQALTDPSPYVRAAVVNALARIGPAAEPHLMAILERGEDIDPFVRARAAEAAYLVSPGSAEAARRVFDLCRDPEERVRESASVCLVGFARNGLVDPLVELLADAEHRGPALQGRAEADEAVLHQILSQAQRAPSEIGRPAAEALSAVLRQRWTVEDLKPELASLETEVRLAGLEGLALIGGEEAVQEMLRLLAGDPARQVRLRAAQVLSAYVDDLSVLQALHRAEQSDPDPEVRRVAGEAEWSISLPPH